MLTEEIAHIHVDAESLDAAFTSAASSPEAINAVDATELENAYRDSEKVSDFAKRHGLAFVPFAFGFRLGIEYALHLQEEK